MAWPKMRGEGEQKATKSKEQELRAMTSTKTIFAPVKHELT